MIAGAGPDGIGGTADDVEIEASAFGHPYAYTGREWDPESGLYYYRARYYDPMSGRFLQEDPVLNINQYHYTENNPVNFTDPEGRVSVAVITKALVVIAAVGVVSSVTKFMYQMATTTRKMEEAAFKAVRENIGDAEALSQGLYGKKIESLTRDEKINVGRLMPDFKIEDVKQRACLVQDAVGVETSILRYPGN